MADEEGNGIQNSDCKNICSRVLSISGSVDDGSGMGRRVGINQCEHNLSDITGQGLSDYFCR